MPRLKKVTSIVYEQATVRAAALRSIDDKLDLGNSLTLEFYNEKIEQYRTIKDDYNTMLSNLDAKASQLRAAEHELRRISRQMLDGVSFKFTRDSEEYEKAGGTRLSNIKRRRK